MNLKKTIFVFGASLFMASCTDLFNPDQLNMAPKDNLNETKIFTDYNLFRQYADHTYSYMPGHLARMWCGPVSELGDESRNNGVGTQTPPFNTGAWGGSKDDPGAAEIADMWDNLYVGIRKANMCLNNIDKVTNFPEGIKDRYIGEMHFLRGFFYFELIKRWGGVPIVPQNVNLNEELDLPRNTYDDCVEYIVEECNAAAAILPEKHADYDNGRATRGAALALKSRTLLYAARPLHNPNDDVTKWEAAARAAKDVIDLGIYKLHPEYEKLFFEPICDEVILNRPRSRINGSNGFYVSGGNHSSCGIIPRFYMTTRHNGWCQDFVTQNMVDKFEDSKGYPIDHKNSIYDKNNPYINRDPRLDKCILRDGRMWCGVETEFWIDEDGKYGLDKATQHTNRLGYTCIKYWPDGFLRYGGSTTYLNYIFFRYAEILLNFAEAQNEAGGPSSSLDGLSVRKVLTDLRKRVNQVPIPEDISDTRETMRKRIWNERAVELCFEEHRWYDVISWHKGVEFFDEQKIYGMNITKHSDGSKTYETFEYQDPTFKEHMHLYPIPYDEVYKSKVLKQNPGWPGYEE